MADSIQCDAGKQMTLASAVAVVAVCNKWAVRTSEAVHREQCYAGIFVLRVMLA